MNRKRKNPQKNNHSVQAKKKPNAEIEIQCELGQNTYRFALKKKNQNLPLSSVPDCLSIDEATKKNRKNDTPTRNEVIPNSHDEIVSTEPSYSSPVNFAVQDLQSDDATFLPSLISSSGSNYCDNQSNNNISSTSIFYESQPLEAEANIMSTVTEVKLEKPLAGGSQIQMMSSTNTFRSSKFGSASFEWLRDINFDSISVKLFVNLKAQYDQAVRAELIGELTHLKNVKRSVSIFGQNPDTILKIIVINLNEYFHVLCALRTFLTRYRQPDHVIETPLHLIFCHLFEFQSDFRKLRTTEGKCGVAHYLYFFTS